jgi:hypothetical protein
MDQQAKDEKGDEARTRRPTALAPGREQALDGDGRETRSEQCVSRVPTHRSQNRVSLAARGNCERLSARFPEGRAPSFTGGL